MRKVSMLPVALLLVACSSAPFAPVATIHVTGAMPEYDRSSAQQFSMLVRESMRRNAPYAHAELTIWLNESPTLYKGDGYNLHTPVPPRYQHGIPYVILGAYEIRSATGQKLDDGPIIVNAAQHQYFRQENLRMAADALAMRVSKVVSGS